MTLDSPFPRRRCCASGRRSPSRSPRSFRSPTVSGRCWSPRTPRRALSGSCRSSRLSVRPRSWQILNLCTSTTAHGHFRPCRAARRIRNRGLEHGVQRVHVRLPSRPSALPGLPRARPTRSSRPSRSSIATGHRRTQPSVNRAHPRGRRDDIGAIYLLYLRTTPSTGGRGRRPLAEDVAVWLRAGPHRRDGRDNVRHLVVERPGIVAWAAIRPPTAAQPASLSMMVEDTTDCVMRSSMRCSRSCHQDPRPACSATTTPELIRALQQRGFAVYGTQLLLISELGEKVRIKAPSRRKSLC